jgi:pilus assembly protein FimV
LPGLGLEFDEGELQATALAGLDAPDLAGEPEFGDLAGMDGDDLLKEFDLGGLDDNDFGNLDEVGTKLDLATAYVEMGDADGARDMLEEVLQEGDAEQKQKAQELLDQIAAQA